MIARSQRLPNYYRLVLAALCAALLGLPLLAPPLASAAEWKERASQYAVVLHPPELANTADQLSGVIDPVVEHMAQLHEYTPRQPFKVRVYASADLYAQSNPLARTSYGETAYTDLAARELAIAEPRLRNLTTEQVRNLFRRGFSQLMLADQTGGRLPIGLQEGVAQYSERPSPEVEVNARLLDRARRDRALLSWTDLNTPAQFIGHADIAAAQSYAVVSFLFDRYGLAAWQRLLTGLRTTPDYSAALAQAYGKPMATLEAEWNDYLPEYLGGSYTLNHFARYDLADIETHLQAGRYHEARDAVEQIARFVAGAGRANKEAAIKDLARRIVLGLEGDSTLTQGRVQMAAFQYDTAHASFQQARQRYEATGATDKVAEADAAIASAEAGITALGQLADAQRWLAEFKYAEARAAATDATKTFAQLGDEEHYRQSWTILQGLNTTQTRIAYILAAVALANVIWAFWRLRAQAVRRPIPGVLQ